MKKKLLGSALVLCLCAAAVWAATAKRTWTALAWINAAGSASYDTLSGTTEEYTSAVDMVTNGYLGAHVEVDLNFDATPTDNLIINVWTSLDGSTWSDIAANSITVDNGTDPAQLGFVVEGWAYFRIGVVQDGSTDTHDFRVSYRAWQVDIS